MPVGTLRAAKSDARGVKYEPLKNIQAIQNAMNRGCGHSLDEHVPLPEPPSARGPTWLEDNGCLIFVADQESKQRLRCVQ